MTASSKVNKNITGVNILPWPSWKYIVHSLHLSPMSLLKDHNFGLLNKKLTARKALGPWTNSLYFRIPHLVLHRPSFLSQSMKVIFEMRKPPHFFLVLPLTSCYQSWQYLGFDHPDEPCLAMLLQYVSWRGKVSSETLEKGINPLEPQQEERQRSRECPSISTRWLWEIPVSLFSYFNSLTVKCGKRYTRIGTVTIWNPVHLKDQNLKLRGLKTWTPKRELLMTRNALGVA